MKSFYFSIICIILGNCGYSQKTTHVGLGVGIQELTDKVSISVVNLLDNYFGTIDSDSAQIKYGLSTDILLFPKPLLKLSYYQTSFYYNDTKYHKPTILNIVPQNDSIIMVTIAFSHCSSNDFSAIPAILNVVIKNKDGDLKIGNTTNYYLEKYKWNKLKIGRNYYFWSPQTSFSEIKLDSVKLFNSLLMSKLNQKTPIQFNYILASSINELTDIQGFLFKNDNSSIAYTEIPNNTIFTADSSNYYKHEIAHVYIHDNWPNIVPFFDEGLAVHWGSNGSISLIQSLPHVKKYIKDNKYVELDKFEILSAINVPNYANLYYTIAGLICKTVEDEKGLDGIKKLIADGTEKDIYYAIEQALGVKKADLNVFLRKELEKY